MVNFATVSEIYDLNTTQNRLTNLRFHTPQDGTLQNHLGGFFAQYKEFMYVGMSVTMIPAATLPVDPLQVSYPIGEPTIDPRDVLNPILSKRYNGEATALDALGSDSMREVAAGMGVGAINNNGWFPRGRSITETSMLNTENNPPSTFDNKMIGYGAMLMDPSWKKTHIQQPLSFSARPIVYNVASNYPFAQQSMNVTGTNPPPGNQIGLGSVTPDTGTVNSEKGITTTFNQNPILSGGKFVGAAGAGGAITGINYYPDRLITSSKHKMGWMDTITSRTPAAFTTLSGAGVNGPGQTTELAAQRVPFVYMHMVILPPAFKQTFYYRVIVKHRVAFRGFRSLMSIDASRMVEILRGDVTGASPVLPTSLTEIASGISTDADAPVDVMKIGGEVSE